VATTPVSATRIPASSAVQRLGDDAAKAAARAEAAKQLVRSAKADLKKARKLSKAAKKTAKQARKKVEAAAAAIKQAAAAKTARAGTAAGGKPKPRAKTVKTTSPAKAAIPAKAAKPAKAKTPRPAKSKSANAARTSAAAKPGTPKLLSAAEVAKSVIGRMAAANRVKKNAAAAPSAGAPNPVAGSTPDAVQNTVTAEFEAGEP